MVVQTTRYANYWLVNSIVPIILSTSLGELRNLLCKSCPAGWVQVISTF